MSDLGAEVVRDLFLWSVLLLLVLVSAHVFRAQGYAQITAGVATSRSGCFRGFEIADEAAEWNRTYGGSGWECANLVQQTSDGGYMLAGYTSSFGAGSADAWLVKTDAYGNIEWNKTYGGTSEDMAYDVQQTTDGGYIVCGHTYSFGMTLGDAWLFKTDAFGEVEWSYVSGWPDWDELSSVQKTSDGGYVTVGRRYSVNRYDFWLIKTNCSGCIEWNKTYGGKSEESAWSVQQTNDGGYIMAGDILEYFPTTTDAWLVKTDSYGNMEWNKVLGGTQPDVLYDVQQTSDDGYIAVGETYSFGAGEADYWVVKLFAKHDVAVEQILSSKSLVCRGFSLSFNVTVANLGYYQESFNVTAYANATVVQTQTVQNLPYDATATLVFTWDTTGFPRGSYVLSAYAEPPPNETQTANNQFTGGPVLVAIPGNVNGDAQVNILDVVEITSIYATNSSSPIFNPNSDIDNDKKITILDVAICTTHYGEKET